MQTPLCQNCNQPSQDLMRGGDETRNLPGRTRTGSRFKGLENAEEEGLGFFTEAELNELDQRAIEVLSELDDWVRDELQNPEFGLTFPDESVAGY